MSFKGEQSGTTGSAGAIREAGGAFGKLGSAKEAEYFYKQVNIFIRSVTFSIELRLLPIFIKQQVEQLKNLTHKDVVSKEFQENKSTNIKDSK